MTSDKSTTDTTNDSVAENPPVDRQDPPQRRGHKNAGLTLPKEERSKFEKVLPIAAAGVALAAVGAIAYVKSRHSNESAAKGQSPAPELPLDINKASANELMHLPHIGPVLADKIIKARPFEVVEDLSTIPGIGEHYLKDIARHLKV